MFIFIFIPEFIFMFLVMYLFVYLFKHTHRQVLCVKLRAPESAPNPSSV